MQDEETECGRRNCSKGLPLQRPACLRHREERDLGYNIKCSEHKSGEVQNKAAIHQIDFQHHGHPVISDSVGLTERRSISVAALLRPRSRRALRSPGTLCRVQGGCTSQVHSLKQTVRTACPVPDASSTARCATGPSAGVI